MTGPNWEKRRRAVERCQDLVVRVAAYAAKFPKFSEELNKVGNSMHRMIQLYQELDDRRIDLESQVAELSTEVNKPKRTAKAPKKQKATDSAKSEP